MTEEEYEKRINALWTAIADHVAAQNDPRGHSVSRVAAMAGVAEAIDRLVPTITDADLCVIAADFLDIVENDRFGLVRSLRRHLERLGIHVLAPPTPNN